MGLSMSQHARLHDFDKPSRPFVNLHRTAAAAQFPARKGQQRMEKVSLEELGLAAKLDTPHTCPTCRHKLDTRESKQLDRVCGRYFVMCAHCSALLWLVFDRQTGEETGVALPSQSYLEKHSRCCQMRRLLVIHSETTRVLRRLKAKWN